MGLFSVPSLKGGTPRPAQQVIDLGGERYIVAGESEIAQLGSTARQWTITPAAIQEDLDKEFAIPVSFEQGSGFTFATIPGTYGYSNGFDATALNKTGTWPRRATLAAMPITYADSDATHATPLSVLQGWILPYSTYVYVARGRYCCKFAIDDTQDSAWPIVEAHDFGTGVFITGRPVVFKNKAYFPLRTGTSGSLERWHELSLPVASSVEQQTIAISGTPTSGTYTVTFDGKTTAAIVYNASSAVLQAALRLIAGLEQVTVSSTGTIPNFTHTVVMTGVAGALATTSPPQMTSTDGTSGGAHAIAHATTVAGTVDTWRRGSANTQASCFIVNGTKLWRANANTIAATVAVSTPSIDGDWGATTEVGESGRDITDLGVYEGDMLVGKTDGMYRFTEDLTAVQELPDLASVIDSRDCVGMEFSNGYELIPHQTGLIRWRPGAYQFVGPEQEGALEGLTSLGGGRVSSLAPFGKQLFFAANDTYNVAGTIGSLLPQLGQGRGPLIPHTHVVSSSASYEATRVVTSTTQPVAPQTPATWSDDSAVGTITWSSPSSASGLDASYATAAAGTSHYLKGLGPPVNLPTGATVLGVLVEVAKKAGAVLSPTEEGLGGRLYGNSAVYATARSTVSAQDATLLVGQNVSNYFFNEGFVSFDTSAIPDTATVLSATLSLRLNGAAVGDTTYTVQARLYDWGATLTTADYVAGASLSAKTLLATLPVASFVTTGLAPMTSETAFISNINLTGKTRIILCTDRMVAGTAPTTAEYANFWNTNGAGYVPTLTVTYTGATVDNVVKLVVGGSVTGTNLADAVTLWPASVGGYTSYGGASNLWGTGGITVAQANDASNFGVVFSATVASGETASIDHIRMTVYYSVASNADPQTYRIDLKVAQDGTNPGTVATGQVYKLARANLAPVNDPNVNHASSNAQLYSSRYPQPNRDVAKIYRDVELWLDASPQTNTVGLQVWASVDDGTAFQLRDSTGAVATALTTGAQQFFFPSTTAATGHYVQLIFKQPATGGGTVAMAANLRDVMLRGRLMPIDADEIRTTFLLGDGEFVDRTSMRRTVKAQRAALRALKAYQSPVAFQDVNGDTGFCTIKEMTLREFKFKEYDEPIWVAQLVLAVLSYG